MLHSTNINSESTPVMAARMRSLIERIETGEIDEFIFLTWEKDEIQVTAGGSKEMLKKMCKAVLIMFDVNGN